VGKGRRDKCGWEGRRVKWEWRKGESSGSGRVEWEKESEWGWERERVVWEGEKGEESSGRGKREKSPVGANEGWEGKRREEMGEGGGGGRGKRGREGQGQG
jgi:hypothetical protein